MYILRSHAQQLVQDDEVAVSSAATLATRCVHDHDIVVVEDIGLNVDSGLTVRLARSCWG
jgi:hypoxanthine-guanine phosphoribosyltransferase